MKIKLLNLHGSQWNGKLRSFKSLFLLVAMLLVATSNVLAQASYETIDGIRYLIDSDAKTATVVANNAEKYSGEIVVPEKVKASDEIEYPVAAFGDNAFKECSGLTSITIPSSVTSLGENCFEKCTRLANAAIPSSVTSLGAYCFYDCTGLTSVTIPSSITSLARGCFRGCIGLTSITIPSSVTYLGEGCFYNCTGLTSITIPSSVTYLGYSCFWGCAKLTNITIPSSVTYLGSYCFKACTGLTSIVIPSSITSLGNECFFDCIKLSSITIPSSVTSLGNMCFYDCYSLTSVTIPSSVTSLGNSCFDNCKGLTSVVIPSSITKLPSSSFSRCTNLETVTFKGECPDGLINCAIPTTCIFYVPQSYLQDYKDALGSKYPYIYASKEDGDEEKPLTACVTPTITYSDGKLLFNSSTPNAEYHATITDTDMANDKYIENGVLDLSAAYQISAFATADGYKQSEKATATLYWLKSNATLEDGTSTNINQAKMRGIVATSHDGIVTLSGLDNGEEVRFYTADGKQIGTTKAIDGVASQAVSSTSLIIAKIGRQAIKIAVK